MLDPEISSVVEFFKEIPPLRRTTVAEARALELEYSRSSTQPPEAVKDVENNEIVGKESKIPVRVYSPFEEPGGSIVFYHGGGFVLGSLDTHDQMCRLLARESGCRVVSVGYRLAPEHKFPAAVVDAYDAFEWTARRYTGKVAVVGDSAGGNLSAVVAQLAKQNGVDGPHFQALLYPVLNMLGVERSVAEYPKGMVLTADDMAWFGEQYLRSLTDATDIRASPILSKDLSGLSPALVVTAEYDPLRDQGEVYSMLLRKAGVSVVGIRYTGMVHGFLSFPLKVSRDALRMIGFTIGSRLASD